MGRISVLLMACCLLLGAAGCGKRAEEPSAAPSEAPAGFDAAALEADARAAADSLIAGDYAAVCARFDATLAAQVTEAALKSAWETTAGGLGAYVECVGTQGRELDGYYTVDVTERFEKGGLLVYAAYGADGKLAGLRLSYKDVSGPEETDAYTEEELTVTADEKYPLGATLTLPKGVEKPPVVILVQGSGATDRNETVYVNSPFREIAHGLAARGVAVLRYDKRHFVYPESGRDLAKLTLREEVLDDVGAAIALLEADARVDGARVYVLGHSLGGMLAPAIAAEHPEVAGLISMAGSLRPLWEIVYDQNQELIAAYRQAGLTDEMAKTLDAQAAQVEADIAVLRGDLSAVPDDTVLMGIPAGYWKSLSQYGGMNFIAELSQPMLILQGSADFQVYPERDYVLWQETLAGRGNVTFRLYEGLNHIFMPTQGKRDVSEYETAGTVSAEVIADIAAFILG